MKRILKKNQIVIFTIALMLIVAGYMNYTANTQNTLKTAVLTDTEQYAQLGDAQLVSSNVAEDNSGLNTENNTNENIEINEEDGSIQDNTIVTSKSTSTSNQYFTQSKIDRDNMYSQMIESYNKILDNTQISSEQKLIAENEISNINNKKNSIMIAENLIKNKGFEDIVIFINDKSVSVVVKSSSTLTQEQIAQIQNIIERELKADVENIHISTK